MASSSTNVTTTTGSKQASTSSSSSELERKVETVSGKGHCSSEHQLIMTKEELTEDTDYQLIVKTSELEGEAEQVNSGQGQNLLEGYGYKLVDKSIGLGEDMTCPICNLIPRVPAKVNCCGHIYCDACITKHSSRQNPACPICNARPFKWMTDKSLERKINNLQVHCINYDKGCRWTGELRYAQQHLNKATPASPHSPSHADRWTKRFTFLWRAKNVTQNTASISGQCNYQPTTCKKCDKELLYGELDHHSKNECKHRTVPCEFQFAGCEYEGPEVDMAQHIQEETSIHLTLAMKYFKSNRHSLVKYWLPGMFLAILLLLVLITATHFENKLLVMKLTTLEELESDLVELRRNVRSSEYAIDILKFDIQREISDKILENHQKLTQLETDIEVLQSKVRNLQSGITKKIDDIFHWFASPYKRFTG